VKEKVTIHSLKRLKQIGQKICMVTAYDAAFARIFDDAGADVLLVGDSLGMTVLGYPDTTHVQLEEVIRPLVVADERRHLARRDLRLGEECVWVELHGHAVEDAAKYAPLRHAR